MMRRRFERALRPVWAFHRWYDDLVPRKMEMDRFIIFMSLIVIGLFLPPVFTFILGQPYLIGQLFTVAFFAILGLTRIYYLDYLPRQ